VLIVPVRHHSPAAALHVGRLIRERRPKVVLIEGPADATPLIDQVLDAATAPPIALYAYERRGEHVRASFFPFCAYSPEYVALRVGREVGAELAFCDLPASETLGWVDVEPLTPRPPLPCEGEGEPAGASIDEVQADADDQIEGDEEVEALGYELGYEEYTTALAEAAGFDSFEGFWEAAFEQEAGQKSPEGYVEIMATFGGQARTLLSSSRGDYDDRRERAMAATARAYLDRGVPDEAILLVCGAAHARAIAEAYAEVAPSPTAPPCAGEGGTCCVCPTPAPGGGFRRTPD
jgi:hypothetical protein